MKVVVDCSVAIAWLLVDEESDYALALLERLDEAEALAPTLWLIEATNVITVACRRGRIDARTADDALAELEATPITIGHDIVPSRIHRLAQKHGLTAYDAVYLELALRTGARLATLDKALRRAAEAEGVFWLP